jgi:hypothetical protein
VYLAVVDNDDVAATGFIPTNMGDDAGACRCDREYTGYIYAAVFRHFPGDWVASHPVFTVGVYGASGRPGVAQFHGVSG